MSAALHPSRCPSNGGGGGGGGSGSGGGNGGSGGGGGPPCGACKFLRRKCVAGCIFAPYFGTEQGAAHFSAVHRVFGASNFSKLLLQLPEHRRMDAVVTVCFEAQARIRDPVQGCVAHILFLQQQVANLQAEMAYLQTHFATLQVPTPPPPPQPITAPLLSMADLPSASSINPPFFDLSPLFDPMGLHQPPQWHAQAQSLGPMAQFLFSDNQGWPGPVASTSGGGGSGDLQALAREFLQRQGSGSSGHVPHNGPVA